MSASTSQQQTPSPGPSVAPQPSSPASPASRPEPENDLVHGLRTSVTHQPRSRQRKALYLSGPGAPLRTDARDMPGCWGAAGRSEDWPAGWRRRERGAGGSRACSPQDSRQARGPDATRGRGACAGRAAPRQACSRCGTGCSCDGPGAVLAYSCRRRSQAQAWDRT
jgi:hypothetical protein